MKITLNELRCELVQITEERGENCLAATIVKRHIRVMESNQDPAEYVFADLITKLKGEPQ